LRSNQYDLNSEPNWFGDAFELTTSRLGLTRSSPDITGWRCKMETRYVKFMNLGLISKCCGVRIVR
jgi:hypothetical protein